MNAKVETVKIKCPGYEVVGTWADCGSVDVVLNLIGYGSYRSINYFLDQAAADAGVSMLTFDYSGHGESPFKLEETRPAQHIIEAITAYDWLADRLPKARIHVMGSSYGGYIAAELVVLRSAMSLILRVPAILAANELFKTWGEYDPAREQQKKSLRYDLSQSKERLTAMQIGDFSGGSLVVVHGNDETIPKQTTDAYIEVLGADIIEQPEFTHSISDAGWSKQELKVYADGIFSWLDASMTK